MRGIRIALATYALCVSIQVVAYLVPPREEYTGDPVRLLLLLAPSLLLLIFVAAVTIRRTGLVIRGGPVSPVLATLGAASFLLSVPVGIGALVLESGTVVIPWGSMAILLVGTLLVGIDEELIYRGIVLNGLAQQLTVPAAVGWSSLLFGLMHTTNALAGLEDWPLQVVSTTLSGLVLGWTYMFSGRNLVLVVVMHWLYNWSLMVMYVVRPDGSAIMDVASSITSFASVLVAPLLAGYGMWRYQGVRLADLIASDGDPREAGKLL